jgi:hypothetical protein
MDTFGGLLDDFTNQENAKDTLFGGQRTVCEKCRIHTATISVSRGYS